MSKKRNTHSNARVSHMGRYTPARTRKLEAAMKRQEMDVNWDALRRELVAA